MASKLAWGVLGNATIARKCVIPAIQKSRNGAVSALATRSAEQARTTADTHGIETVYEDYEALLEDPQIDIVYIPLPNHLHHPWTIRALAAGKHVLCEKPLACTAMEAQGIADAARQHQRLVMEGFMYRFHPRSLRIKAMIEDGAIGALRTVRSAFCYHMDPQRLAEATCARLSSHMGGGALLDVGCYSVSVARWLMENEPLVVQAQAVMHGNGVDLHMVGTMQFPDDRMAILEASFISALQQTYSVIGDQGAIELPHDAFIPWEREARYRQRGQHEEQGTSHGIPAADEYQLMVEHFADAVAKHTPLAYTLQDSIANMRVLDALAKAARTGHSVAVTPQV
jgi:predicted dehydrogenase